MIVQLPKKKDQKFLTNKCPITLLNVIYKIVAKVMQRCLTLVLQRVISPQQFAFLPGRNIHHSLFLLEEMLHQAESTGEEFVLLKMDVTKAFDSLECPFLLACLEKCGLAGTLTSFMKASFANAASTILLNGRLTRSIPLYNMSRSVQQGCPLSPLLFILAFDSLNYMLHAAITRRTMVGMQFSKQNVHALQNMYADELYLIIQAILCYILELQQILQVFGKAFGFFSAWDKTVASAIPARPLSPQLWLLPWKWEDDANASPPKGDWGSLG